MGRKMKRVVGVRKWSVGEGRKREFIKGEKVGIEKGGKIHPRREG